MSQTPTAHPHRIRRALRLVAVIGGALIDVGRSKSGNSPAERALWLHRLCRDVVKVLGIELRVGGRRPPGPAGLITANHVSYLDIIVLAADAPCVFVAKSEVASWPLIGACARAAGTVFITRNSPADVVRVGAELEALADAGVWTVLFPEGTSTDGGTVLPFRSSLLEPAIRDEVPLLAVGLSYDTCPSRSVAREVCWWGDMTLPNHLWNLLSLPWIVARLRHAPEPTLAADRKTAARLLRDQAAELADATQPGLRQIA